MVTWPVVYLCLHIIHILVHRKKIHKGVVELSSIFASKIFDAIRSHLPSVHVYAHDTQLNLSFCANTIDDQTSALAARKYCISDIRSWIHLDKLKLNNEKTESLLIDTRQQLAKVSINSITVGSV